MLCEMKCHVIRRVTKEILENQKNVSCKQRKVGGRFKKQKEETNTF